MEPTHHRHVFGTAAVLVTALATLTVRPAPADEMLPVPADYQGTGQPQIALFRGGGSWVLPTEAGRRVAVSFGTTGDVPVPRDYLGLRRSQIAVFRPSTREWFVRRDNGSALRIPFGGSGDQPVPGDYFGLGRAQIAVFRPAGATWFLRTDAGQSVSIQWGASGDRPVPGDYLGLGRAQIAVFRPSTREWFVRKDSGEAVRTQFGGPGDEPLPGDYFGAGRAQMAVFRPATGEWFLRRDDGSTVRIPWGAAGDRPIAGDYLALRRAQLAVFRPATGEGIIRNDWSQAIRLPLMTAAGLPLMETVKSAGEWDGVTQSAALETPYEDRRQAEIPFGRRSYYLAPWRAYMDTWPASRLLECLGINFNVAPQEVEAVAQLLGEAGIRSARIEIPWSALSYDDPTRFPAASAQALTARLRALQSRGIRPLLLLNGNSQEPCPLRNQTVTLTRDVAAGAREIFVDRPQDIRPGYTGLRHFAEHTAFPLITAVDAATGRCTLSAPVPYGRPAGGLDLTTLKYQPFGGATFSDGRPNSAAQEALEGWKSYVGAVCQTAKTALGTDGAPDAGFDVEVWNEYGFGSEFLDESNYYKPSRSFSTPLRYANHGLTREGIEILLPITVDYVTDPARKLPGVNVISGFANQRPWDSGAELWPGQAGFSRHFYTNLNPKPLSPTTETNTRGGPLNALGKVDGTPDGADWNTVVAGSFFIPTLTLGMPEFWHYGYGTEFMTRDVQPFPSTSSGPVDFSRHFRYSHAGNGRPAQVWMSEFNVDRVAWADELRRQTGAAVGDPRLITLLHHVGAKSLLRTFVFHSHKGVHTIDVYAAKEPDSGLSVLPTTFFAALAASGGVLTDTVRAQVGEQLTALRRVTALMRTGQPLETARPLGVGRLVEHQPRLVFDGDGTPEHPDQWHRGDFACLPFQLDAGRFAVGYYVVTRDLGRTWDPDRAMLDPARYDMPEQFFDLTLTNVRGTGAQVSTYDPLTDRTMPVDIIEATGTTLTVRMPSVDYPRFLILQETGAGPLIQQPQLVTGSGGAVTVSFRTNVPATAKLTWGAIPERSGAGSVTLPAGAAQQYVIPSLGASAGVQIEVTANGLTARWPRWGHDVAGRVWPAASP